MIKNHFAPAISELSANIRASGLVAAPIPGTPLEILNATVPMNEYTQDTSFTTNAIIDETQFSRFSEEGKSHHCVELQALIKSSAKRVRALLDLSRNFINPMVEQVVSDINSEYELRLEKVAVNLEVVTSKNNPLFKNESIRDLVNTRVKDIPGSATQRPSYYSDFITDKIGYLSKAIVGLEAELAMYLGQIGEEKLNDLFETYFLANNPWDVSVGDESALPVLLFCQRLAYDRDAENFIEDVGLGQVRESLENLAALAAVKLKSFYIKYDRREKNKRLIVSYPEANSKLTSRGKTMPLQIVVEEDLYKEFLETGGSPDLLCGAYIVDQERDVEAIMANQKKYLDRWQRRVSTIRQTNEQAKFDIFKRSIINSLTKQLNEDFEQAESVPFDRDAIFQNISEYLAQVSPLAVNNPYPIILHIASCIVFQNKQAESFLMDMCNISKHNVELDVREVASQATLNYIVKWVRSQIVVGKP